MIKLLYILNIYLINVSMAHVEVMYKLYISFVLGYVCSKENHFLRSGDSKRQSLLFKTHSKKF